MPDSNWSVRLAVIGSILACLLIVVGLWAMTFYMGKSEGFHEAEAQNYAAQYPADTDERISRCPTDSLAALQACVEEAVSASHDAQRSERDLDAQRNMAEWAKWLTVIGLSTAIISAFGLWALMWTLLETRKSVGLAGASARIAMATLQSDRAWLMIVGLQRYDIIECDVVEDGKTTHIKDGLAFELIWENCGRSPAINLGIAIDCRLVFDDGREEVLIAGINIEKIRCTSALGPTKTGNSARAVLSDEHTKLFRSQGCRIALRGIAIYNDVFGPVQHQSRMGMLLTHGRGEKSQNGETTEAIDVTYIPETWLT